MSSGNYFETRRKAYDLRTKDISATYTTRAGGSGDTFIEDRVITITNPAANTTINVSDGTYEGQELLITTLANTGTVTITLAAVGAASQTAVASTIDTAGKYQSLLWVNVTVGWVVIKESITT